MKDKLLHPATFIALIALFVALSGSAYAVSQLPKNSVGTKQLKNSSVTTKKIKKGAVTSESVKDGSLSADDFSADLLSGGASGADGLKGEKGDKGDKGDPGPQGPSGSSKVYVTRSDTGAVLSGVSVDYSVLTSQILPAGNYLVQGSVLLFGQWDNRYVVYCRMGSALSSAVTDDRGGVNQDQQGASIVGINLTSELKLSQPGTISITCSTPSSSGTRPSISKPSIIAYPVQEVVGS